MNLRDLDPQPISAHADDALRGGARLARGVTMALGRQPSRPRVRRLEDAVAKRCYAPTVTGASTCTATGLSALKAGPATIA